MFPIATRASFPCFYLHSHAHVYREPHDHRRASALDRADIDVAIGPMHPVLHPPKTNTKTLALLPRLRGEIDVEKLAPRRLGHPSAGITDRNIYPSRRELRKAGEIGLNAQFPALRHGFDRVSNQIFDHQVK